VPSTYAQITHPWTADILIGIAPTSVPNGGFLRVCHWLLITFRDRLGWGTDALRLSR
jgi:hypothetical protein